MAMATYVRIQRAPFDMGGELSRFGAAHQGAGAVVSFTGVVRNNAAGTLQHMEIEHYPGMSEKSITAMAARAKARWELLGVLVIHRYGLLRPGALIMMVATASPHRQPAFTAAQYLMDYLKSQAPFWKKEHHGAGAHWVAAREEDAAALARWSPPPR